MLTREEILKIFGDSGALLNGHFKLTSGLHSDRYVQCALVLQHPGLSESLCRELAERLGEVRVDAVVGPATGGIILAYELARLLGARALFGEREEGKMVLRRGFRVAPGERVLAVEDVVTTGGSVGEVVSLCREAGAEVVAAAALVDRSGGKADPGCRLVSLLPLEVQTFDPGNCPLCARGLPAVKPGSRA